MNRSFPTSQPANGTARPASNVPEHGSTSQPKRQRKERGPNWMSQEILALISAKRDMFLEDLDTVDRRDLMTPENTKWAKILQEVMHSGVTQCLRDGPAYKTKWNQLIPNYKRIADYFSRTGTNVPDYWELSTEERKTEGLPKEFGENIFAALHEWYGA